MQLHRELFFLILLHFRRLNYVECEEEIFEPTRTILLKSGQVKGYVESSSNGIKYYGFRGIPYAKPPIKSLRFKAPKPADGWNGILDCKEEGHICPQAALVNDEYKGHEDCLTMNVYTPQQNSDEDNLLPVMVAIHGGGYVMGSGGQMFHGPQMMMNHPVVLVTFNYRLGVLGFLSTENKSAHGNYGMLDQVLALKWVQENVQSFGGDRKRVTLYGVSAGASSIVHHMLSPLSKGLFHKAIMTSGSVTNYWAVQHDPLQWAQTFAKHLNCPNSVDSEPIIRCLSEIPAEKLIIAAKKNRLAAFFPTDLIPTIDPNDGPGFQTKDPTKLLKQGLIINKVPVIFGMANDEGYSIHLGFKGLVKLRGREYFKNQFPVHLESFSPYRPNMTLALQAIANEYYDHVDNLDDEDVFAETLFKIVGDAMFSAGVAQTAELFSQAGVETYAFIFNYTTDQCFAKAFGESCGKYASHADDMLLSFRAQYLELESTNDLKMSETLTSLWTSFIYDRELFINENYRWPLYNTNNRQYVVISENSTIKSGLLSDKIYLWTEILSNLMHKIDVKDEL